MDDKPEWWVLNDPQQGNATMWVRQDGNGLGHVAIKPTDNGDYFVKIGYPGIEEVQLRMSADAVERLGRMLIDCIVVQWWDD